MSQSIKSSEELKQKLTEAGDKLVVIDFHATWCGPCKLIGPKVDELAVEHTDVVFVKVDVEECTDIATEYSISFMPTFVFMKNNKKLEEFSDANLKQLKRTISRLK